jgi:Fe-S cluster assembly protein SufD
MERFAELGFPTDRNEDWRFTNLTALAKVAFQLGSTRMGPDVEELLRAAPPIATRLVFVNGHYQPGLTSVGGLPKGVVLDRLSSVLFERPGWAEPHLAQHADDEEQAFVALNTSLLREGAFLLVPKGVVVESPIQIIWLNLADGEPTMAHPRSLFILGEDSQATIVETHFGMPEQQYFANAVTEIVLENNAQLDHMKLQREGKSAFHLATTQVRQARGSNFRTHYLGFGGGLVRNEVRTVLDAEGCEATVNGLYLASGTQHMDNLTVIDHAQPHCASHELYKGILDGKSHGVFNGKIFVRQDAQKTDAKQTNQTLLLSEDATINTKPQLEILADDVKCTHGATVGQLDAESLFYLRSRGLGAAEARALLTFAFANDIIGRIRVPALRKQLETQLLAAHHLPGDFIEEESP